MNCIGDFVEKIPFSTTEELLKKVRHLPDGVGFFGASPIWKTFFQMTPYSEFDFDAKHFQVDVPKDQLTRATQAFLQKNQFLINAINDNDIWTMEKAFIESFKNAPAVRKPLLLNFSCQIEESAVTLQKELSSFVDVVHIGTQFHCTTRESIDVTFGYGQRILPLKKIDKLLPAIESLLEIGPRRPVWVRLNLDSLAHSQGGGPQSWATGLQLAEIITTMEWWLRQISIVGVSIGTSNLAAVDLATRSASQILSTLVYSHMNRRLVSYAHGKKTTEIFS